MEVNLLLYESIIGGFIISFCMETVNEMRLFKDISDAGYKIKVKGMSELGKKANTNESKVTFLLMLIPIFNIMKVIEKTILYNNARSTILDQLSDIDVLEEMSEWEKQEYSKNPTGLNALLVLLKTEIRLSKVPSVIIIEGDDCSEIFYEIGDSKDDITIIKVNGYASRLTVEEQKKKVIETWKFMVKAGMEKYGDGESFINEFSNALNNNTNLDLSPSSDGKVENVDETNNISSFSEQKQQLENLKNELLEQSQIIQESRIENGPTLKKKRK